MSDKEPELYYGLKRLIQKSLDANKIRAQIKLRERPDKKLFHKQRTRLLSIRLYAFL